MPSAAEIAKELEQARAQAAALHDAANKAAHEASVVEGNHRTDIGLHRTIKQEQDNAKKFAKAAEEADRAGDPLEAENLRELAAVNRATASAKVEELARRKAGTDKFEEGIEIDDPEWNRAMTQSYHRELAADALDDRVRLLEQAEQSQRQAEENPDDPKSQAYASRAEAALAKAAQVKPDYANVDPDVLESVGVPLSERPGSELMDPADEFNSSATAAASPAAEGAGLTDGPAGAADGEPSAQADQASTDDGLIGDEATADDEPGMTTDFPDASGESEDLSSGTDSSPDADTGQEYESEYTDTGAGLGADMDAIDDTAQPDPYVSEVQDSEVGGDSFEPEPAFSGDSVESDSAN
jgi:hypothetical protein